MSFVIHLLGCESPASVTFCPRVVSNPFVFVTADIQKAKEAAGLCAKGQDVVIKG